MTVRLLILGATGLVGRHLLEQALVDVRVNQVVAPTRKPLTPHPKLLNPVIDFDNLPDAEWWSVEAAISALGTTRKTANSAQAFRAIELHIPLSIARLVRSRGASSFVVVTAGGANARSRFTYSRTKGELEESIEEIGFPSFTIVRPAFIGGERYEFRAAERIAGIILGLINPILPPSARISPAYRIAQMSLDAAISAVPGRFIIDSTRLGARQNVGEIC